MRHQRLIPRSIRVRAARTLDTNSASDTVEDTETQKEWATITGPAEPGPWILLFPGGPEGRGQGMIQKH